MKELKTDIVKEIDDLRALLTSEEGFQSSFNEAEFFKFNVFGMHIKELNNALSDENPHVCIGWHELGDLSNVSTKDDIKNKYNDVWPDAKARARGQNIGQIWRFLKEMKVGDYVVFADDKLCHIGKIISDYYYDTTIYEGQAAGYVNVRKVVWLKKDIHRSDLSTSFHRSLTTSMSVWGLNDYKSAIYQLLAGTYVKDEVDLEDILIKAEDIEIDYSLEELGKILSEMYRSATNKTTAIHMFAIKYAEKIINKGYAATDIVKASKISDSYHVEVNKGISIYKSIKDDEYGICFYEPEEESIESEEFDFSKTKGKGINKIFYGVPGCGKSYHIQHDIIEKEQYEDENVIRTTFYQDYSNTDFIGQILPKIVKGKNGEKDTVEYIFNPGPFTLALIKAISNPDQKIALIVEEINRGNAPAIFGDAFQLLDRDKHSISEYGIVNVGMMDYLNAYEFTIAGEKKHYKFKEIKIPGNMDIFATMNTSDQNVYTLDTAFVRRWEKVKIKNTFDKCSFKSIPVPGMPAYNWEEFVTSINDWITSHLEDLQVNEDKQVGAFFVKEALLIENDAEKFAYKVFDYLWSDVAKLDHSIFFNPYDTLEKLISGYKSKGVGVFKPGIFGAKSALSEGKEESNE